MVDRAVVVMGKVPRPGRVKTRLQPALSPEMSAKLYAAFLGDVFDVVDRARERSPYGFDRVFACALSPDEDGAEARRLMPDGWRIIFQRGDDLGSRIAFAYEDTAAFKTVIIGSDAPTMPPERILDAFSALDDGVQAVFGPTSDGGYDLIALKGVEAELLERIPWSTDRVMETTRVRARASSIAIRELSVGYDVDAIEDLPRALEDASRPGSIARRSKGAILEALASRPRGD